MIKRSNRVGKKEVEPQGLVTKAFDKEGRI